MPESAAPEQPSEPVGPGVSPTPADPHEPPAHQKALDTLLVVAVVVGLFVLGRTSAGVEVAATPAASPSASSSPVAVATATVAAAPTSAPVIADAPAAALPPEPSLMPISLDSFGDRPQASRPAQPRRPPAQRYDAPAPPPPAPILTPETSSAQVAAEFMRAVVSHAPTEHLHASGATIQKPDVVFSYVFTEANYGANDSGRVLFHYEGTLASLSKAGRQTWFAFRLYTTADVPARVAIFFSSPDATWSSADDGFNEMDEWQSRGINHATYNRGERRIAMHPALQSGR